MYLMLATRPDIAYAVNKTAQYSTCYDLSHWTAVKRIIRYIKGTQTFKLRLGLSGGLSLSGACDADWGGDIDDRRSTGGYLFWIANGLISWQTRKQSTVATSSTQAEYQALSNATKEALWIQALLGEIGFLQEATVIQQDNQSTITLANNPINHNRTKHIDIAHHFIRECIEENKIAL